MEVIFAALFAASAAISLVYGLERLLYRNIQASKFAPGVYKPKPEDYKETEKETNSGQFPARPMLLIIAGMVTAGFVVYTVVGIVWLALAASLAGLLAPRLWSAWQERSKAKLISSEMEQAVEIMAAVLGSGGGMPAALEKAALEVGDPLGKELSRASAEIRVVTVSTAVVFERLAKRVKLPEMAMLSMAVQLQQTGMAVNMVAVLSQIQDNIRGRRALEEEVSAITAENRLAGWIVAAVPFVTLGIMRQMAPDFVAPLFGTTPGLILFVFSCAVIVAGLVWINRMAAADNLI